MARFEIAVASPAPAAPMLRNCGRTKNGSSRMFKNPPADTPKEAIPALPSPRIRFASRMFRTVPGPPMMTVHIT